MIDLKVEYKLLDKYDLLLMEKFIDDSNTKYKVDTLKNFIDSNNSYGFICKTNNIIIGFAYGYSLLRPDGRKMFYIHFQQHWQRK